MIKVKNLTNYTIVKAYVFECNDGKKYGISFYYSTMYNDEDTVIERIEEFKDDCYWKEILHAIITDKSIMNWMNENKAKQMLEDFLNERLKGKQQDV